MTAAEWSEWIRECRRMRESVYRSDADEVTANHNREVGHVRDYRGREILELIQNADDAGRDYGANGAKLVLQPFGLCVANTGRGFSPRGVKSLVVSDKLATTARQYTERFFLYRVYVGADDRYKLVELQNPMGYDWPKSYRVNPFLGGRAKHWDLRSLPEEFSTIEPGDTE